MLAAERTANRPVCSAIPDRTWRRARRPAAQAERATQIKIPLPLAMSRATNKAARTSQHMAGFCW
jgi:hypothetical protein